MCPWARAALHCLPLTARSFTRRSQRLAPDPSLAVVSSRVWSGWFVRTRQLRVRLPWLRSDPDCLQFHSQVDSFQSSRAPKLCRMLNAEMQKAAVDSKIAADVKLGGE